MADRRSDRRVSDDVDQADDAGQLDPAPWLPPDLRRRPRPMVAPVKLWLLGW